MYLKSPSSPDDWQAILKDFEELWNLALCVGAIVGNLLICSAQTTVDPCSTTIRDFLVLY